MDLIDGERVGAALGVAVGINAFECPGGGAPVLFVGLCSGAYAAQQYGLKLQFGLNDAMSEAWILAHLGAEDSGVTAGELSRCVSRCATTERFTDIVHLLFGESWGFV